MSQTRTPLIIANWKMNGTLLESMQMVKELRARIHNTLISCQIVMCPPFTLLRDFAEKLPTTGIKLGGQNCHHAVEGAFTGEVSAAMLKNMTCSYVILGHSERRMHLGENSEIVAKKSKTAIEAGLTPVICMGETRYEKENNLTEVVLREQLLHSLPQSASSKNIVIAYEPVWAIGTGLTPSNEEIAAAHAFILDILQSERPEFGQQVKIIYGGSVSGENAQHILSIDNVDGLLVGKASQHIDSLWPIIKACDSV